MPDTGHERSGDGAGSAFAILPTNVLAWAAGVIVPANPGVLAVLGLVELQGVIEEVREAYGNQALHVAGLVLTRLARNNVHRDVEKGLRESYGDRVFRSTIPLSTVVEQAHTVMQFAPRSPAAVAYEALVEEVVSYGRRAEDGGRVDATRRSGASPTGDPGPKGRGPPRISLVLL